MMEFPALSSVEGAFTRLDPIRPIQLLARSLPRNGAEMKITRPISGRCRKMSASVRISLAPGESDVCSGGLLYSSGDSTRTLEYPQSIAPLNAVVLFCIPSKNKPAMMVKREFL